MKKNIFAQPKSIRNLFKNEKYLYPDYLPERLPHRDTEIDSLVYAFNPVLKGGKPVNVAIFGSTGVGKTCTVKYVLNELEDYSERAKGIYINCFEFNTRHAILSKITSSVGMPVPRRGIATDEIYTMLLEGLKKNDSIPIIVLDEIDQLLRKEDGSKLLYDLLRLVEYQKTKLGIVILSNDLNMNFDLDARVRSSFMEEKIIFNPYSPQQLKDILRERVNNALFPNVLEDHVLGVAAAHAAKLGGDCRIAIESLLKAGRLAERENSDKITLKHLRDSFDTVESNPAKKMLKHLTDYEKIIIKLLSMEENEGITSGELYDKFRKEANVDLSERRIREIIAKLQTLNMIKADTFQPKHRGKTRKFSLTISKEIVSKELAAE